MEQIGQLIGWVAKPAYNLAIKHINYVACVSRLIKKLKEKRDKLNDKKGEIDLRVERARGEGKVIIPGVNKWLEQVTTLIDNVNQFLDQEKRITDDNKSCFHQCCCFIPNHHKTGKEAETLTTTLNEMLEETKEACFSDVGVLPPPPPPPDMALLPTAYSKEFDSRESLLENIIEALKVNDMIGIYGMAGVGKTVLVNRLVDEVKSWNLFDKMGMVVVSQNPNTTTIQNVIIDRILGHDKELHANSEEGKKDLLHAGLENLWKQQKKRVLLVVDDAWEPLVLHEVGIPCPNKDFKIVVTSRFRPVCAKMGAKESFEVCVLGEQEAWILFRKSLGEYSKVLDSGKGYKDVAEEMVTHLKGLPLAIVTLACALIEEVLPAWRDAAKYLKERQLSKISGMPENVIGAVELSFNYLRRRDAQIIFLLCCLFPEDWNIEIKVLMEYGIGLGLFEDVSCLSHTMDRIVTITEMLKSRSLLLEGDNDGEVKMHDVTRDVALHIASKGEFDYLVKEYGEGRMGNVASNIDKLGEKHAISILTRSTNPIEILGRDKEYPNLHILRLQCIIKSDNRMPIEFPTCFFERIGNFKILEIRQMSIDGFPTSSFLGSLKNNLRTLCLYDCWVIDIAEIGELTNLEILDLQGSWISGGLYEAVQRLNGLRVLDLRCCTVNGLADNFVRGLPDQLEGLYLTGLRITDDGDELHPHINKASKTSPVELELLTRLEMLEVVVGSLEQVTDKFLSILGKLSSFNILLTDGDILPNDPHLSSGPSDKILRFWYVSTKKHLQRGLGHLLRAANKLYIIRCHDDSPIMSLQYYNDEFSNLTKSVANQHIFLSKLKSLCILGCPLLPSVFTKSVAIQLQQLKDIYISNCDKMKEIFTSRDNNTTSSSTGTISSISDEEGTSNYNEELTDDTCSSIILPSLQEIVLSDLPHLKHFAARNTSPPAGAQSTLFGEQVKFPELESLILEELDSCEKIWESHLPSGSFGRLRKLCIWDCNELRYIFSAAVARSLMQLQELDIAGCSNLEEVVVMESVNDKEENNITFPGLCQLSLWVLDSLRCFCSARNSVLEFPSLEEIMINDNSNMQVFSYGSLHTPKLTGRAPLSGGDDLNTYVARMYEELNQDSNA